MNAISEPWPPTITLERNGATLVIKDVPAEVCANCGEEYVSEDTTSRLLKSAEEAVKAAVKDYYDKNGIAK